MRLALLAVVVAVVLVPARARAGDGKALLPLVADDAQLVLVVDVADARDAPAFTAIADAIGGAGAAAPLAAIGLDPVADLDTIVVAGADGGRYVVIVEGRFDAVLATLDPATKRRHRKVAYWEVDGGEVAVIGKRLVLSSAGEMKGVIDRAKKKQRGLTRSSKAGALRAAIAMTDTRHDAWVVALPTALGQGGFDLDVLSIGVSLDAGVAVEARMRLADPQAAADAVTMIQGQLDQIRQSLGQIGLAQLAASIAIQRDDRVVEIDGRVSDAELQTLLSLATMF